MPKRRKNRDGFSFDFSSLSFGGQTEEELEEIPRLNLKPVAFENAEAMADSIGWEKDYFCLVSGSFIFGDFIEALCFKKHLNPSAIYITTLGMSKENIDSIVNLTDYLRCKQVNLIVSNYFAAIKKTETLPYLRQECAGRPIDVAVLATHCKIIVIQSNKGDAVIAGSANLSSSNNVEQFTITHDPGMVQYLVKRLDNIMKRFTIIHGMDGAKVDWKKNKDNTGKDAYKAMAMIEEDD